MGPIARILLRYIAGALVMRGLITPDVADNLASDPELIALAMQGIDWFMVGAGAVVAAGVEWAYRKARKLGWAT